jgi:hypothetical protein
VNSSDRTAQCCLFNVWTAERVSTALEKCGYKTKVPVYFHKVDKTFKHHQSPFISNIQSGGYFFKDSNFLKELKFPEVDAGSPEYSAARSSLQEVKVPEAVLDERGNKVLDCPQDPSICSRFWQLIKHLVRSPSVQEMVSVGPQWRCSVKESMSSSLKERNPTTMRCWKGLFSFFVFRANFVFF